MSCPFPKESIEGLKKFVQLCQKNPGVLHLPDLAFFKDYLESMGAIIPDAPSKPTFEPKTHTPNAAKPPSAEKVQEEGEEEDIVESDVELDMEGVITPEDDDAEQQMGPEGEIEIIEIMIHQWAPSVNFSTRPFCTVVT